MKPILEIACFNLESALIAQDAGSDRIEFCEDYRSGGISPDAQILDRVRNEIHLPLQVMIRPRAGNFVYSREELDRMMETIDLCKEKHLDGIVFGALTSNGSVDRLVCQSLVELAKPMQTTFHRAIDQCKDIEGQIEFLITLGVDRILTSGGKTTAIEGASNLRNWHNKFGTKIIIMPGGGIRSDNINQLISETGCSEFHSAAITKGNEKADREEIRRLLTLIKRVD